MNYRTIEIRTIKTEKEGSLSFFESERDIPFIMKRMYYIHGADKGVYRGGHAHKELYQFVICVYGKILFIIDDGNKKQEIVLDSPEKGLYLEPGLWRDMIWEQKDSVLCVMASEYYDENDYIRDYDLFKKWKGQTNE